MPRKIEQIFPLKVQKYEKIHVDPLSQEANSQLFFKKWHFWGKLKPVWVNRLAFKDSKFLCWTAQFFLWSKI